MKLIALACDGCGGPLRLPDDVPTVTCLHCGLPLSVVGRGAESHTVTLAELEQRAERTATGIDQLYRESTIAELDQRWTVVREEYLVPMFAVEMIPNRRQPERTTAILLGTLIALAGLTLTVLLGVAMSRYWGRPGLNGWIAWLFPLIGLLVAGLGARIGLREHRAAQAYERAEEQYRQRRMELGNEDGTESPSV